MSTNNRAIDFTGRKSAEAQGIDFLDVRKEKRHYKSPIDGMDAEQIKDFCMGMVDTAAQDKDYQDYLEMIDKINRCYYDAIPRELEELMIRSFNNEADVILTRGSVNKVRQHVRVLANILLKNRPVFEPDPSGASEQLSEQDLIIATRFLEHAFDKGGLRMELPSVTKEAIRTNRGIMKVYWSDKKKDIEFKEVRPMDFFFDFNHQPEDSNWYCEKYKIRFYDIAHSGLFTPAQIAEIEAEISTPQRGHSGSTEANVYNYEIDAKDFYFKVRGREDEEIEEYCLITIINDNIIVRKTHIAYDDLPFAFFIPEREATNINYAHSINDVCNASVVSAYMNYKILNWVEQLSDISLIVDEKTTVDRAVTPGVRTIRLNSVGGVTSMQPIIPNVPMIPQDIFFHMDRLERVSDSNLGIHPDILTGINGNVPGQGILSQTMLANDIQNTSMISQEFSVFLGTIAYKILHIAFHMYQQHKTIKIDVVRGDSDSMKIIGGANVSEKNQGIIQKSGIHQIRKFPQIKVKVIPGSAYTEAAKNAQMLAMFQANPEIAKYIPIEDQIETFAQGSANLMIHKASREAKMKREEEENHEIAMANAENKAMAAGVQRIPQPNDDHRIHLEFHAIEEMYMQEQLQKAADPQAQQEWTGKLNLVRAHMQAHSQMMQAQQQTEAETTIPPVQIEGVPSDETGTQGSFNIADEI